MIGRYPAKMDDKGRLFVPAKLREALGGDFYVTIGANGSHRCLTVYTAEDFHTMENNYNALNVAKRSGASTLIFAFAKLLAFYKTDMTNDDPAVTGFMKTRSVAEILANTAFWGEDLTALLPEVEKYVDQ